MDNENRIKFDIVADASQILRVLSTVEEKIKALGQKGNTTGGVQREAESVLRSYSTTISDLTKVAEDAFIRFKQTGDTKAFKHYNDLIPVIRQLTNEHEVFNRTLSTTATRFGSVGSAVDGMKRHLSFIGSGMAIGALVGLPVEAIRTMADVEQRMAQMLQTLPQLYKDYTNHVVDQKALSELTREFIGIGSQYGQEIDKIIEAGTLWSRGYKDVNEVLALTHLTAKLAIADLMDLKVANTAVESVINSYRQQGNAVEFANHVVDAWTNVAHNAQSSATDLAESLKRSAAAAYQVGVSFDFANSLASTLIKNSGQTGAVVGNSLKAIFSNIHSKKGIAELEELGIAVYEFDENGTKHFRNVESVFTDIMIKMQGSSHNFEETMKHISSGFQWNRAAALFSDYEGFIKAYNLSINSSGVADKQVAAQLDTIARKAEQLKANLTGIIMGGAEAGLSNYIKSWLDSINNLLKGLQQIPTGVYTVGGSMVKWGIILYASKVALDYLDRSIIACTMAKASLSTATATQAVAQGVATATTNAETAAMTRLGIATTAATGGLNLIFAALVATGIGAVTYASGIGEATTVTEHAKQKQEDLLAVKQQELEMNTKQSEFIGTLANSYVQLQGKLNACSEDETKANAIKKSMGTTIEELTKLIGEEGIERLKQSQFSQDAIKAEQDTHNKYASSIKGEINEIKSALDTFTDKQIDAAQARIESLYKETEALSIWRKAQLAAYDFCAGLYEKQLGFKRAVFNNMPDSMQGDKTRLAESITNDEAYLANLKEHARDGLRDDIAEAKAELARLKLKKFQHGKYGNNDGGTTGGTEVNENQPKDKQTGAKYAPDKSDELAKLWDNHTVNAMFADAKIKADEYKTALDRLNVQQEIFGVTADVSAKKFKLFIDRITELSSENTVMESLAKSYEEQANNMIVSSREISDALNEKKTSWNSLSKDEKIDFVHAYSQYVSDEKLLIRLLDLEDKLKVKIADNKREIGSIDNSKLKETYKTPEQLYQKDMKRSNLSQQHEIYELGYKATEQQKQAIELKYALEELTRAKQRLSEIETQFGKDSDEYKKQQVEVDQLKNKVDQLGNSLKDKVSNELHGITSELLLHGSNWRNIWDKLWKGLADDALKALFRIQNNTPSLLSNILGLFGGGGVSSYSSSQLSSMGNKFLGSTAFPHADGGIFDEPHLGLVAEAGREGIVPMSDKSKGLPIWTEIGRQMGAFKGEEYVPTFKNPDLMSKVQSMSIQMQQDKEHISELRTQSKILMQLTEMMYYLTKNSSGNSVVAQPVIVKQSMTPSEFQALAQQCNNSNYKLTK